MNVIIRVFGWLKFILLFVWLLFLILIGAKVAQLNPQLVQLDLLFWTTPEASLGVLLCVSLLVGVVLGVVAMAPSVIVLKAKLHRAQGKVVKAQKHEQSVAPAARDQVLT